MALIYLPGLGALSLTRAFHLAMSEPSTALRKLVLVHAPALAVVGAGCGFRGRAQGTKQLSDEAKKPADRVT